jgi:hypothetical protein
MGRRRVCAWGRLAQFTELLALPGVVRVDVLEHGAGPPHMGTGTAHASIALAVSDDAELQRHAAELLALVESVVWPRGVLLTVAVRRARWVDRAVSRARWRRWTRGAE